MAVKQFESVKDAFRYRMRHGLSVQGFADLVGVHRNTIINGLNDRYPVDVKTLAKLGLKRISIYEWIGEIDTTPRKRKAQRKARKPEHVSTPVNIVESGELLTTARVLVAVRFKLNPGATWAAFPHALKGMNCDRNWEFFCKQQTAAIPATQSAPAPSSDAPVLYGHLKYVERGVDHRRPLVRGELPQPVQRVEVEVNGGLVHRSSDSATS